jgi:hypothetical protein
MPDVGEAWAPPRHDRHVYVVLRWDGGDRPFDPNLIVATKAFDTREAANAEAARLNELNAGKASRYFVLVARLQPPPDGTVAVTLTRDEALVLDAYLSRGAASGDDDPRIEDQAERRVLWDLAAVVESQLPDLLTPDYDARLAAARDRVRDTVE